MKRGLRLQHQQSARLPMDRSSTKPPVLLQMPSQALCRTRSGQQNSVRPHPSFASSRTSTDSAWGTPAQTVEGRQSTRPAADLSEGHAPESATQQPHGDSGRAPDQNDPLTPRHRKPEGMEEFTGRRRAIGIPAKMRKILPPVWNESCFNCARARGRLAGCSRQRTPECSHDGKSRA